MSNSDQSPEYWAEYSNLQHVKHSLIQNYLNGWFPKLTLGRWGAKKILYVDTHAGRGQHLRGQLGSPLVALTTLLDHNSRDALLAKSTVDFLFIERDKANVTCLRNELSVFEPLPKNVSVFSECGDSFDIMQRFVESVEKGQQLAPSFVFVDPYGFKIPGRLLRRLLQLPQVELFVNVIWRELDMAISQGDMMPPGMAETLDSVFDGSSWKSISDDDSDVRAEQCVNLLRKMTRASWATYIRMLGKNGKTRYFLLHLTNHPAGRDLMKECVWKACPNGGYYARRSDNPQQQMLIEPEPDLHPLENWIKRQLSDHPVRWHDLTTAIREELWLSKHLNQVLREMRKKGVIEDDQYTGRFAAKNNPRLRLVSHLSGD